MPPSPRSLYAPDASGDAAPERRDMVETQLAARGIHDPMVLAAMGRVPRETFVVGVAFVPLIGAEGWDEAAP